MAKYCMKCGEKLLPEATECGCCGAPCPNQVKVIPPLYRITDSIISRKVTAPAESPDERKAQPADKGSGKDKEKKPKSESGGETIKTVSHDKLWIGVAAFAVITIIGLFIPIVLYQDEVLVWISCGDTNPDFVVDAYLVLALSLVTGGLAIWRKRLLAMIGSVITGLSVVYDLNQEALLEAYEIAGRSVGYYLLMLGSVGLLVCGILSFVLSKRKRK